MKKRKRLFHRYLLFVLPLVILSVMITGGALSWICYRHFQETINSSYKNIIRGSAGEIGLFMKDAQKGLEGLAWVIAATKLDPWQKEMALAAFHHTAEEFMFLSLVSPEGEDLLTSGWQGNDVAYVRSEIFQEALQGERGISDVMVAQRDIPYVYLAVPILHLGAVKEVLWGQLNLKSVWDVLEGIKVGATGRVSILDLSGRLIGDVEMSRVVKPTWPQRQEILEALQDTHEPLAWMEEEDHSSFYCLGYRIPNLDWIIVLRQRCAETYAYLYKSILWGALITAAICLAAVLAGWNRVEHFLAPIQTLHGQVQRIGGGDLDQRVSVDTGDEIGDLAEAFNDMTDSLKRLIEREVASAKELAHAKNLAVLGSTSSKVTHEVGNLLNNVGLTLSILKNEGLSPGGENALHILEKDSARVKEFIANFLQFAKTPELHLERRPLEGILREVLFLYQGGSEKGAIELELDWPPDLPPVLMDQGLMYQVFHNLVKNGMEAMGDSGKIEITGRVDGEHLVVVLKDTGPGMGPEVLEQIFDPFYTTKGKKGTGLGLSIVKTIVQAHRGTIECQSQLGSGTTFIVRLPLQ
ncbi:MAG: sensor histidine kinase [Thermodesulfobacteriota bacterium]|nr:sensor histidine kinase [Thermodesulfobacteriota bacterium]